MGRTHFSGPITSGTQREGASANFGHTVLKQTDTFGFADTGAFATEIVLPAGSQILDMFVDLTAAWNATADALEIGTASNADAYGDVADLQTTGRVTVTIDADQAGAIDDIGTADKTVYLKITSTGSPSAGAGIITVLYAQD